MTEPDSAPEIELEFPPKPEYIRAIRQAIAALARLHGADDSLVEDIKLAVSEACTSALNSNIAMGTEPVEVRARGGPQGLVIDVLDRGTQLDHEVAGHPTELSTADLPFESALAVPIIRGLVDDVAFRPRQGGGAMLRMTVSLEAQGA